LNIQAAEENDNMRMAISALVLSAFLAPAIASAQPMDGGLPPPVPVPDGGLSAPSSRSTHKDPGKDSKAKKSRDDSGSEGSSGSGSSSGGSSGSKSAHGNVDGGVSSS
jgi:hypothetical protein